MEKGINFFNRGTTFGGKCFVGAVFAAMIVTVSPLAAAVITSTQATFVQNGTLVNNNFGNQQNLQVANRSAAARKAYIDFDLSGQLPVGDSFDSASLTLTTTGTPLIGTSTGNVTFSIYGLINGNAWTENALTWNTSESVANDLTSNTAVIASATTLLGTITLDTTTLSGGQSFTLTNTALVQYLNWAAGLSGNYYGNGVTGDITPTFIVTAQGSALGAAGVNFASDEFTTASSRPSLTFTTVPEPGTVGLIGIGILGALLLKRRSERLVK